MGTLAWFKPRWAEADAPVWKVSGLQAEAHSEPNPIFKMELFAKIVNGWKPLSIFA